MKSFPRGLWGTTSVKQLLL